jgi:2-polyprenyl-6-methoxyphenol hydroxylase-like FAD-dependent oxidoreductase
MIDMSMNMPLKHIVVIGGGISGLCSALALSRHVPDLRITVFERHPVPSTSGGAISLSPVALRHLDYLGVLPQLDSLGCEAGAEVDAIEVFSIRSGKPLGSLDFAGSQKQGYATPSDCRRYKGRRVMRIS